MSRYLSRQLLLDEIEKELDALHNRGFFLSVTLALISTLNDIEILFVWRSLKGFGFTTSPL